MAIAYDNSSSGTSTTSSITVSHTASGSDRIAFALISNVSGGVDDLSSVTYGGSAMTLVTKAPGAVSPWLYVYYIVAPATGAQDVVATKSSDSGSIDMMVHSYTGASQTDQPDASVYESEDVPGGQALTKHITTVADECWIVAIGASPSTLTASTGSTQRQAVTTLVKSFDSGGAKSPAGDNTMAFTFGTDADPFLSILVSFKKASAALTATVTETSTLTETISYVQGKTVTTLETATMTETTSAVKGWLMTILETLGLTDLFSGVEDGGWTRQAKNNATLTNQQKSPLP